MTDATADFTFASGNPAAVKVYELICAAKQLHQLDSAASLLWQGHAQGAISDNDAESLHSQIERLRGVIEPSPSHLAAKAQGISGRSRWQEAPRSPDREKSRKRRRKWGGPAALPAEIREHYTPGQAAALAVIADQIRRHKKCTWPIDKIAGVAGVCRTTVKNALRKARRDEHLTVLERPRRGAKSLPNLITVLCERWRKWINLWRKRIAPIGGKAVPSTSTKGFEGESNTAKAEPVETPQRGLQGVRGRSRAPDDRRRSG